MASIEILKFQYISVQNTFLDLLVWIIKFLLISWEKAGIQNLLMWGWRMNFILNLKHKACRSDIYPTSFSSSIRQAVLELVDEIDTS